MGYMKRKYEGYYPRPAKVRRLVSQFVPRSVQLRRLAGRAAGYAGKGLLKGAARAVPYLGAALAAKDAYDFGKDIYNRFRTPTTIERAPTQNMRRAGRVGTGRLAGKVRAKKRNNTKLQYKGKSTKFGLQVNGVHSTEEHRFTSKTNQVDAARYETIQIGHTTLPQKTVLMNVARAMIKHCCAKMNVEIRSFQDRMVELNKGYAFHIGDIFRWNYWPSWIDNAELTDNFFIQVDEFETFETFAYKLVVKLRLISETLGAGKLTNLRWKDFEYAPEDGLDKKAYQWMSCSMTQIMCEIQVKSALKVQNRTVNAVGDDDDGDDVDNVPLTGKIFKVKGNNVVNRNFRRILRGVGAGNVINNDIILFDGIARQQGNVPAGDAIYFQPFLENSDFNKPAEPMKSTDIINCVQFSNLHLQPGAIKTSVITQSFKLPLTFVLDLLCSDGAAAPTLQKYNPKLGYTAIMHLEKAIGSFTSSVAIAAEVQYDIWCAVTSKKESKYTNRIGVQVDYGVYPV
jgi:hypothetical protein